MRLDRQTDRQTDTLRSERRRRERGVEGDTNPSDFERATADAICIYSRIGRCHGTEDKLIKSRGDALRAVRPRPSTTSNSFCCPVRSLTRPIRAEP